MARVFILKVGPFEDGRSLYVPIADGGTTDLDPVEAADDASGLDAIMGQYNPLQDLVCSPELERAARARGLPIEAPPALFEATRIQLGRNVLLQDDHDQTLSSWAQLTIMRALIDLANSNARKTWTPRQPLAVELRGDRTSSYGAWMEPAGELAITLVADVAMAEAFAKKTAADLSAIDHLRMWLVVPPVYIRRPLLALYRMMELPRFQKVEHGQRVVITEEDVFVMAGVVSAIGKDGIAETRTPDRTVQTLVGPSVQDT